MKILMGKHLDNKYVDYFKTNHVKISLLSEGELEVDVDGEYGGTLPVEIKVMPAGINILKP